MKNLNDEYYSDEDLCNYKLENIEDDFVKCKVMTRDTLIYSKGIYKIISRKDYKPLIDNSVKSMKKEEVLQKMPNNARRRQAVPSIKGQYLTVKECSLEKKENGDYDIKTVGKTHVIPVEFVIDGLSKNQAILNVMD